jgi:hypothetical protein
MLETSIANRRNGVIIMLDPETLVELACIAVLPYLGEAVWTWARRKCRHH